jgi:cytochrome c oxidase assembly protein subunit 15
VKAPRLAPDAYRKITFLALAALCVIIVTGAAVRLTQSGLGCPQWPNCDTDHLVPRGATGSHGWIEFVNRTFTGLVSVLVILAVLGSLLRTPRRRDLTWLSAGLVAGVIGQIVLGGLTVLFDLAPGFVMSHFLLSLVLVATAATLHHRAGLADDGPPPVGVAAEVRAAGRWVLLATGVVVTTGTIVTGTGPHGGDAKAPRLNLLITDVARVHGVAVNLLVALTLMLLWLLHRTGAPTAVATRARVLLAVEVAQAAVGYTQYFTGVPELLVAVHVVGAVSVWLAACGVVLATGLPDWKAWARPESRRRRSTGPQVTPTSVPIGRGSSSSGTTPST